MSTLVEDFEIAVKKVEGWNMAEAPTLQKRLKKFISHPTHYLRHLLYIFSQKRPIYISTKTFFNAKFNCYLPDYFWTWDVGILGHPSEIKFTRFLLKTLKPGDVFLDVGSNCGFYSVLSSRLVGEKGSVHAFEPTPRTFRMLRKNTYNLSNAYPRQVAVSDVDGQANFLVNPVYSVANSIITASPDLSSKIIKVNSISLDSYCREFNVRPSFVKLDVEGAEERAVLGATHILSDNSPYVSLEIIEQDGKVDCGAAEQLVKLGYTPHLILPSGDLKEISFQDIAAFPLDKKNDFDNFIFKKL